MFFTARHLTRNSQRTDVERCRTSPKRKEKFDENGEIKFRAWKEIHRSPDDVTVELTVELTEEEAVRSGEKKRECCGDQLRSISKEAGRSASKPVILAWGILAGNLHQSNSPFFSLSLLPLLPGLSLFLARLPFPYHLAGFLRRNAKHLHSRGRDHRIECLPVSCRHITRSPRRASS